VKNVTGMKAFPRLHEGEQESHPLTCTNIPTRSLSTRTHAHTAHVSVYHGDPPLPQPPPTRPHSHASVHHGDPGAWRVCHEEVVDVTKVVARVGQVCKRDHIRTIVRVLCNSLVSVAARLSVPAIVTNKSKNKQSNKQ
jgi:hypothetical protein